MEKADTYGPKFWYIYIRRMPSSPLTSAQTLVQSLYNIYIVISQNTFLPTLDVADTCIFISYLPLGITGNKQWLNRMNIF